MDIVKKGISWLLKKNRLRIHRYMHKEYDNNPFRIEIDSSNYSIYQDLAKRARLEIDFKFIETIERDFGYVIDHAFIHDLALTTQITIKSSKPLYLHGYLLYGVIRNYLEDSIDVDFLNILETGTGRGFSCLVIAKALDDAKRSGKIITLDILPTNKPIYWNCIFDHKGRKTRFQLLKKWQKLVDEYIIFLQGYSDVMLRQIDLSRIHVVFLDGAHDYDTVKTELSYVKTRQSKGDVIVCDDYTEGQYPGLVDAVKQFLSAGEYSFKIYYASTGRGYLYCKKK